MMSDKDLLDDSDEDDLPDVSDDASKKIKAINGYTTSCKITGSDKDYTRTKNIISKAFKVHKLHKILDPDDAKWQAQQRLADEDSDQMYKLVLMKTVLDAVLESTFQTKGAALTAYKQAKIDGKDVRGQWLAICNARKLSTVTLTERKLNKARDNIKFTGENYDSMIEELDGIWQETEDLVDEYTGLNLVVEPRNRVNIIIAKIEQSQEHLPEAQQTWAMLFQTTAVSYQQSLTPFNLAELHSLVRPKMESTAIRKAEEGQIQQRFGNRSIPCFICKAPNPDHKVSDCPNFTPGGSGKPCNKFNTGNCPYGADKCWHVHKGNAPQAQAQQQQQQQQQQQTKPDLGHKDASWYAEFKQFKEFKQQHEQGKSNSATDTVAPWHTGIPDTDGVMRGVNRAQKQAAAEEKMKQKSRDRQKGKCRAQTATAPTGDTLYTDTLCEPGDLQGQFDEFERNEQARKMMIAESEAQAAEGKCRSQRSSNSSGEYNSKYKNELSELMQLAEWDLKNAKAKDPDGDYSVFDFMP